ncbi:UvrD-helicase domain-containing protein, partial [Staphylococcus sp. 231237_7MaSpsaltlick]
YIIEHIPQVLKYLSAKYTHIFIDEYQDCGLSQHKVFLKLVDSGIIGIAVGDLNQSIFAFAKKYPKYLEELTLSEQFIHCQLTVNHRCHHSISDYSLELLEKEYERQPSNDLRVFKINIEGTEINIAREIEKKLNSLKSTYNIQNNNDFAILCKSNNIADLYSRILKIPNKVFKDTPLDRNNDAHSKIFKDLLLFYYSYQLKNDTINEFVNTYIHESNSKNFRIGLDII